MEKESTKIHQILSMKGGLGDESYAKNSKPQRAILSSSVPVLAQAVLDFCDTKLPHCITIADLGCSSGPNTLFAVTRITSLIYERLFYQLSRRKKWAENGSYISGVPGSFYGRLFPSNSLHFVHSGTSLHWLSQIPPELNDKSNPLINKGKIYISKTSPAAAIAAYQNQFQKDFFSFLMARSKEVVPGGRMVFTLNARRIADPTADESCLIWDYLGQALQDLVLKGLMEEEKLDTYNVPYYEPYVEEIKTEIAKEGSFTLNCLEIIALPWDACNGGMKCDRATTAKNWVRVLRAINEPMVRSHFGAEVLDPFFQSLTEIIAADTKEVEHVSAVVYVTRKD
ncbi:S-ADENOSYL-L-METHIONINE:CARBOXYL METHYLTRANSFERASE FAMILY PROTEIN [Salix viminalis]|uniref:S-ADENOSYL-L-METHIONINE:CARBOXYL METHYLTRANSFERASE FAMILY PROTEIN n=1 Tax=Salix viminalis TaxID=40686 RepID=A0A9Q0UWL1_SALVM|nr:S-ADENOSYL-L-METHIONINE:CARBOXYL METHYLTRANSFERASE FAMILY PROTEIN [Salix viminalis]